MAGTSGRKESDQTVVTRFAEMASARRTLGLLVRRDIKLQYTGSALGYLWTLLEPLTMAGVYWLIFTVIMGARNLGEQPYLLFLLCGLLPYNWLQACASNGCKALTGEAKIVRSASVPREIWVLRVVLSKLVEFFFAIPIIVAIALLTRTGVHWQLIFVPVAVALELMLAFGIALIVAPLNVLADDVQRIVRIIFRVGFYLTPVIYGITDLSTRGGEGAKLAAFNPMSGIICLYRLGFWPDQEAPPVLYVSAVVSAVFFLALGLWVFRRLEGPVLKEI